MGKKKFLVFPSGGTAASMGSGLRYIVSYNDNDYDFLPGSWLTMLGLTDFSAIPSSEVDMSNWDALGGSPIIPSCKNTNVFKYGKEKLDMSWKVRDFCKDYTGLIILGGGETTRQAQELFDAYGIKSLVVLATMDNDLVTFDNMLGFRTAVKAAANSIIAVCNDAYTMQRPMIIFTMGYDCGRVAVNATKEARKSGAKINFLHIPESGVSVDKLANAVKSCYKGGPFVIVASEGVCKSTSGEAGIHKKFSTAEYTDKLSELSGVEFKGIAADYLQRSGKPDREDNSLAYLFSTQVHWLICSDTYNQVIGSFNNDIINRPFAEVKETLDTQDASSPWYSTPLTSLESVSDILVN